MRLLGNGNRCHTKAFLLHIQKVRQNHVLHHYQQLQQVSHLHSESHLQQEHHALQDNEQTPFRQDSPFLFYHQLKKSEAQTFFHHPYCKQKSCYVHLRDLQLRGSQNPQEKIILISVQLLSKTCNFSLINFMHLSKSPGFVTVYENCAFIFHGNNRTNHRHFF